MRDRQRDSVSEREMMTHSDVEALLLYDAGCRYTSTRERWLPLPETAREGEREGWG